MVDVFRFVSITALALVLGGAFFGARAMRPVIRGLPTSDGLRFHQLSSARAETYMKLMSPLAGLSTIIVLILDHDSDTATLLAALGLVANFAIAAAAIAFHIPTIRKLDALSADTVTAGEFEPLFSRVDRLELLTIALAGSAFALYLAAALVD